MKGRKKGKKKGRKKRGGGGDPRPRHFLPVTPPSRNMKEKGRGKERKEKKKKKGEGEDERGPFQTIAACEIYFKHPSSSICLCKPGEEREKVGGKKEKKRERGEGKGRLNLLS